MRSMYQLDDSTNQSQKVSFEVNVNADIASWLQGRMKKKYNLTPNL